MIRCVRLWTNADGKSQFEEGHIALDSTTKGDLKSKKVSVGQGSFEETPSLGQIVSHTAPTRQIVVTLSGTLEFETRDGGRFDIGPGDILLAEDTSGSGHSWRMRTADPWRRMYVTLDPDVDFAFQPDAPST